MKRQGNLFARLVCYENLFRAFQLALRGKKNRPDCADFAFHQERYLFKLQSELEEKRYRPGGYHTFYVYEKKKRLISATSFYDRVVHHALCNVLTPIFEPAFVYDSYANRINKGTHRAVDRCSRFAQQYRYVLKCDIRKYFPTIDHQILKNLLRKKIKDADVLWLADLIIDRSNEQEYVAQYFHGDDLFTPLLRRRGLPIGNQTSQFFANVYLDPMDHFIKESLRCRAYVRYVDDFLLFADDKETLWDWGRRIQCFLISLRLGIHPYKFNVFPLRDGISFLGYRVFPSHRLLPKENILRFRKRLRKKSLLYADGLIELEDIRHSISGWLGHANHANSFRARKCLLQEAAFIRVPAPVRGACAVMME